MSEHKIVYICSSCALTTDRFGNGHYTNCPDFGKMGVKTEIITTKPKFDIVFNKSCLYCQGTCDSHKWNCAQFGKKAY
jgi:hypothetical protein